MSTQAKGRAYDLVFSVPTMDFVARVGRSGKYAVPLMDELLVRILHFCEGLSVGAVSSLLRVTGPQLDSFLEPLLRNNLISLTEDGLLALGSRGVAAMSHASGEPPRLTKVEEGTEMVRVDLLDMKLCISPKDRRQVFQSISINPPHATSRSEIRNAAEELLLREHADHMNFLFERGYRYTPAKEIEYIVDMDDGRGGKIDINVHVRIDDEGHGFLEFPDFGSGEQVRVRRNLFERSGALLGKIGSSFTPESERLFSSLARITQSEVAADAFGTTPATQAGEFWSEDSIVCRGRLESRDGVSMLRLVDKVITRLGLLKGDQERRIEWIVALASQSPAFAKGRDYFELVQSVVVKVKKRNPAAKFLLIAPEGTFSGDGGALGRLADACGMIGASDRDVVGIDGIFLPGELAYAAFAKPLDEKAVISTQHSLCTIDADRVRQVTQRIFHCAAFNRVAPVRGFTEAEWFSLLRQLQVRGEEDLARKVQRLKSKLLSRKVRGEGDG